MTLCPIAVVTGCKKCPAFSICPLKTVIGDQAPGKDVPSAGAAPGSARTKKSKPK